jgi:hypothetical protein
MNSPNRYVNQPGCRSGPDESASDASAANRIPVHTVASAPPGDRRAGAVVGVISPAAVEAADLMWTVTTRRLDQACVAVKRFGARGRFS